MGFNMLKIDRRSVLGRRTANFAGAHIVPRLKFGAVVQEIHQFLFINSVFFNKGKLCLRQSVSRRVKYA